MVALNRAIAIAQDQGPQRGLEELHAIPDRERLVSYPFYEAAFGEFELRAGRPEAARGHFQSALALARSAEERRFFQSRVEACEPERAPLAHSGA